MIWENVLSFLGVRGIIIVVLLILLGVAGLTIRSYQGDIKTLNAAVVKKDADIQVLQGSIGVQNKSIQDAADKKKSLEEQLALVALKNHTNWTKVQQFKDQLAKQPIPKTCDTSIDELRTKMKGVATDWNSK